MRVCRVAFIAFALVFQVFIQSEAFAEPMFLHMKENHGYINLDDYTFDYIPSLGDLIDDEGLESGEMVELNVVEYYITNTVREVLLHSDLTFQTPFGNLPGPDTSYIYLALKAGAITADPEILSYSSPSYDEVDRFNRMIFAPHWGDQNHICAFVDPNDEQAQADCPTSRGGIADVRVAVIGDSPNRQLVVESKDFTGSTTRYPIPLDEDDNYLDAFITFQVVFNELNESPVYYNYPDATAPDAPRNTQSGASAGFGYGTGRDGMEISAGYDTIEDGIFGNEWVLAADRNNAIVTPIDDRISSLPTGLVDGTSLAVVDCVSIDKDLTYSGVTVTGSPITFDILEASEDCLLSYGSDYDLSLKVEVDFGDGEGFQEYFPPQTVDHFYDYAGDYEITARVSASGSEVMGSTYLSQTIDLTIEEIPDELVGIDEIEAAEIAAEMTGESNVVNDPGSFGLFSQSDLDTAIAAAEADIKANPGDYDLADIVNTPESIEALGAGNSLLGSSVDIDDLDEYFSSVRLVWTYVDGEFQGWSPYEDTRDRIEETGYDLLEIIFAGEGFWVYK